MVSFLKPKFPKFFHIKKHFSGMYDRCMFSNNGTIIQAFEKKMKNYFEFDGDVICVANGTLALMVSIRAMGVKKALVPAFTFPATLQALSWCGVEYEFVDIDKRTWTMDVDDLAFKLNKSNADLILGVHSFGNPCSARSIERLANEYKCKVLYDAAPAIASFVVEGDKHTHISSYGDVSCFSLHATKVMPAGEGGVVFVKDKHTALRIRGMINFGFDDERACVDRFGMNAKMSEIHAAFGLSSLDKLARNQKDRTVIINKYIDSLEHVGFQEPFGLNVSSHQVFSVLLPEYCGGEVKKKILAEMREEGIECRDYYNPPLHKVEAFKSPVSLPVTEKICNLIITLPLHLWMRDSDVKKVSDKLNSLIKKYGEENAVI